MTIKFLSVAAAMLFAGQAQAGPPNPFDALIDQDRAGLYVNPDPFAAQVAQMPFAGTESYADCLGQNVLALARRAGDEPAEIIVKAAFGSCWHEAALVTDPNLRAKFENMMQGKLLADVLMFRAKPQQTQ